MGYTNWRLNRRGKHDMECLAELVRDMLEQKPDHIACAGDLAVIGLDAEFTPGLEFLKTLGDPEHVSLVPGNHDAYVRSTMDHPQLHWSEYMTGDGERVEGEPHFPYLRRRGPIGIIGVSSAVPTGFHSAEGRVGRTQPVTVTEMLRQLGEEGLFRVVIIHHPPTGSGEMFKRLTDARRMKRAFLRAGAELVLHGHNHRWEVATLPGPGLCPIPVIGVPSASASSGSSRPGGYNLYRIEGEAGRWRCEMVSRGFAPGEGMAERARAVIVDGDDCMSPLNAE